MTRGIRHFVNEKFAAELPRFHSKELTGMAFRRIVLDATVEAFPAVSMASASTHYNHAFQETKRMDVSLVEGLGRSEDKKGGRPLQNPVTVVNARTDAVQAENISFAKATSMIRDAGPYVDGTPKLKLAEAA